MKEFCPYCFNDPVTHNQQKEICRTCDMETKVAKRKQTRGDKIRSMTDEELARFLWQAAPYDNCPPVKCIGLETLKKPTTDECIACWGSWLKQEVEE